MGYKTDDETVYWFQNRQNITVGTTFPDFSPKI